MDALYPQLIALIQVIVIDVVLAGDNAIVVGMAASRVPKEMRAKVIFWGIGGAVVLRILFASVTVQLLAIIGLTLAGGILLLWVCWKMYRDLQNPPHAEDIERLEEAAIDPPPGEVNAAAVGGAAAVAAQSTTGFWNALTQIIVADVSMSLDNVLAVAGASHGHTWVLIVGLGIAIVLMAVAATFIAKLLSRYPWISWVGLLIVLYVALEMIWRGSAEIACTAVQQDPHQRGLIECVRLWMGRT